MQVHTDEDIVAKVAAGDTDAFGLLVERYEEKLTRYGRKFLRDSRDIEDIVQDIFVSCFQNILSFDTSQRFSPWIYRIAHNAFVNQLGKQTRQPFVFVDFDTLLSHPVYDDPAVKERELKELRKSIEEGLDQLEQKYREVLILYYLEELSYKDIAEVLQVPQGTVGIRLLRAKEALKKHLTHYV